MDAEDPVVNEVGLNSVVSLAHATAYGSGAYLQVDVFVSQSLAETLCLVQVRNLLHASPQ